MPSSTTHLTQLQESGYVLVKNVLTSSDIYQLHSATAESTAQARAGKWPFIRTLPKQFPPWPSTPGPEGIWGVQHLLHPSQPGRKNYLRSYFHPVILQVVEEVLGIDSASPASLHASNGLTDSNGAPVSERLVMELYNLLVRPDQDFELRWHRDDVSPDASSAEEAQKLGIADADGRPTEKPATYSHTQWNLALHPDDSLIVVPGTHKRVRTEAERTAGPYDKLEGELVVHLEPGDVVFYDNDILHRGKYSSEKERATLHGSVGKAGFAEKRARNVLQHGVGKWIAQCSFDGLDEETRSRAQGMKENLVMMGSGTEVGFSQAD